jgi:hypothetical protein
VVELGLGNVVLLVMVVVLEDDVLWNRDDAALVCKRLLLRTDRDWRRRNADESPTRDGSVVVVRVVVTSSRCRTRSKGSLIIGIGQMVVLRIRRRVALRPRQVVRVGGRDVGLVFGDCQHRVSLFAAFAFLIVGRVFNAGVALSALKVPV